MRVQIVKALSARENQAMRDRNRNQEDDEEETTVSCWEF